MIDVTGTALIHHMRVPIQQIRLTGSWGYLTGSWREAMPYFTDYLINIRENNSIIVLNNFFIY